MLLVLTGHKCNKKNGDYNAWMLIKKISPISRQGLSQHKHKIKHDKTTMQSNLLISFGYKYYLSIFPYWPHSFR
jgi:hypothetical protein